MRRPVNPDTEAAASAFLYTAAEALDTDPMALPTLNDRLDIDYIAPLLAEIEPNPPEGLRAAVEVSLGDVSVLLRDDWVIEVYPTGREPNRLEYSSVTEHDWLDPDPLLWSIGRAVAAASEEDQATVTKRLAEGMKGDAVNRLLRPLASGSERRDCRLLLSDDGFEVAIEPNGAINVEPSLAVLKRSGATLLLVGSVPEKGFDRASAMLLGEPDANRSSVFVLYGRDTETARRRLSMAGIPPAAGTVVEHRGETRAASSSATESEPPIEDDVEIIPVSEAPRAITEAARTTLEDTPSDAPGDLRICVDSLGPMIDSSDLETTRDDIEKLCRTIREQKGIGHFLLSISPDIDLIETLAPLFDVVVKLRMGEANVEQQWRLTGTGHETPWFPIG